MPKKSKPKVRRVVTRRQEASWRLERRRKLITRAIGLSVIAVVVGILAYGYVASYVMPPRQAAARVNDRVFNMAYLATSARLATSGGGSTAIGIADEMPTFVQERELTRIGAQNEGVTVSDEEIEAYVRESFKAILPTPEEEPDAAKREAAFQEAYAAFLKRMRMSDEFYREWAATELLAGKLRDKLTPRTAEQVHVSAILVAAQDTAQDIKGRLDAGEDFAQLATQNSELSSAEQGGDMGWMPRGIQDPKFDEVAFALEPGSVSEPFRTTLGFWVIKVVEKEPDRELSEDNYSALKLTVLTDWLGEQREQNRVETYWDAGKRRWLQEQLQG